MPEPEFIEIGIVLEYTQWRNFSNVVDKAMVACKNSGYDLDYHFAEVSKMIVIGKGEHRSGIDFIKSFGSQIR